MADKEKLSKVRAEIERRIQECKDSKIDSSYYDGLIFAFEEVRDFINSLPEEHVSEDLREAARKYFKSLKDDCFISSDIILAFKAGADWQRHYEAECREENNICCMPFDDIDAARVAAYEQGKMDMKEQFENERLKHCDELTKEQAQIESDFVTQHLKENSRIPTFIDAIEYGMQLMKEQFEKDCADLCNGIASAKGLAVTMAYDKGMDDAREKMMAKAIDVEVKVDAGGYPFIPQMELYDYDKDVPLAKEGDKYKVILIKEG